MPGAPTATRQSRRNRSAPDTTSKRAAAPSRPAGIPTLAEFAAATGRGACMICDHPHIETIREGLREGFSPGTIARYLRIHFNEATGTDTLRKRIIRHVERGCDG